jgi:arabinogalactan endo-1,4-beta-galactosidase
MATEKHKKVRTKGVDGGIVQVNRKLAGTLLVKLGVNVNHNFNMAPTLKESFERVREKGDDVTEISRVERTESKINKSSKLQSQWKDSVDQSLCRKSSANLVLK